MTTAGHLTPEALELINRLAPTTRRDDWWASAGPYDIINDFLRDRDGKEKAA